MHGFLLPLLRTVFLLFACSGGMAWAVAPVLLVLGEEGGVHGDMARTITESLHADGLVVEQISWAQLGSARLAERRIVVSLGSQAASAVAQRNPPVPVLHALLSRASYAALGSADNGRRQVSALFVDQPPERQIALIRLALPDMRRLALLAGPSSTALVDELAAAGRARDFEIMRATITSERELFPALQQVLAEPAVLVATPDPTVFSSYTIQNVLLTAYRHRSPVSGFSAAYARAGALLALYSTPAQMGLQCADTIRHLLRGGRLPPPMMPRDFEVGINLNVARSLGLRLEPAERLAASLRAQEAGR